MDRHFPANTICAEHSRSSGKPNSVGSVYVGEVTKLFLESLQSLSPVNQNLPFVNFTNRPMNQLRQRQSVKTIHPQAGTP